MASNPLAQALRQLNAAPEFNPRYDRPNDYAPLELGGLYSSRDKCKEAVYAYALEHRVVIHYWQAWRLREYILKERYGDWKESFRQVPWLLTRFTVIDPEVQVRLDTLDRCFHRFYVRPSAARHALNYCRPVVALDGTHLISAQKAVLLIAVTIDGNQEILLLAWALVESENKDAWTWFLKLFLEGFPEWARRDDASIISDRDKGLVPAAREVMPSHIPHYFCAWHLEQNLKRFGKAATAFFWRLVKCRSETKWVALVGAARRDFPDMAAYLFGPVRQQPQPQPQPAPRVPPPGARATFEGARDFVFADAREGRRAQRGQERGGNAGNGGVNTASQPEGSGFPEGNTSAYNRRGGGLAGRGGMNAPGRRARAHEGIGVPSGIPDEGDGGAAAFGIGRGGRGRASSGRGRRGRGGGVAGAGLGRGGRGVPPAGDCGGHGGAGSHFTGVGGGVREEPLGGAAGEQGDAGAGWSGLAGGGRGVPLGGAPGGQGGAGARWSGIGGGGRGVPLGGAPGGQGGAGAGWSGIGGGGRGVPLGDAPGGQGGAGAGWSGIGGGGRGVSLGGAPGGQGGAGAGWSGIGGGGRRVPLGGAPGGQGGAGAGWSGIGGGGRGVPLGDASGGRGRGGARWSGIGSADGGEPLFGPGARDSVYAASGELVGSWPSPQTAGPRRHHCGPRGDVTFGVGLGANFMGGVGSVGRGGSPVPSGGDVQRAPASVRDNGLASCSTGDGIGALTTLGNPGARAFDVNTVLRRAREWYRSEDIDTGRTTGTQGSEMGGFTEHFHPASALALPWPDCGQRENIPAPGPDEPACEDDPVPVDATEDGDEAADVDGGPGIHVRTGFYRNRRGSSYRIGGIMLMHWARLFAVTLRFGIYTSNAAESINSAVRGIRMLPPTWLLASLWDWSRDKWYERKEKARCRDEYLTAAASKRLDQKKQRCQGYWFIGGDNSVGTIQTRGGGNESQWRSFNVNLDARTCECGNWEEYQFPCAHAVAMCILKQRSVEILVSEYYTTRNLRQTYNRDVMGTCVDRLIMEAPLAQVGECDAPALIETRVGRPENHTRFEAPPHAYRCGRCRQYGHNRKRCKYKYGGYGQAPTAVGEEVEEEEEEEEEGEDGTATGEHGGGHQAAHE
ncbi:unnamed protein product [Closterium sp. NIES-64]|nr:unnamed protein product [Closterium sp. NIES-64]